MEEKILESIIRSQEILRFRLDTGEECEATPVRTDSDGVVYVFIDCLQEEMHMNPEDTMEGGWEACFMRGYLNNEVLSHFPQELKELLIPINSLGDLLTLPSKEEIFGDPEDPEKQWPAMKLRRNRIAFQGLNGDPEHWWLRSVDSASWAAYVGRNGIAYRWNASYVCGVRPAFKIANAYAITKTELGGMDAKKDERREIMVHGAMVYGCKDCGSRWIMYLEKGLEEPGCRDRKPVPFGIRCPFCGGVHAFDISGYIRNQGEKYQTLPKNQSYFANLPERDCGVSRISGMMERLDEEEMPVVRIMKEMHYKQ